MSFAYITEEGAYIQKRGGNFTVGRNRECIMEIPAESLEGLTLIDTVQVSSKAIVELLRLGIPVTWLSRSGYFFGRLESTRHVNVFRQERQVFLRGSPFALAMARQVIAAKAHNQLILLRRYNRNAALPEVRTAVADIETLSKHIMTCDTNEQLMGYEGAIAKVYFRALGRLVPDEFAFAKRTRCPPRDPFNTMLSFGYTLLMYDLYTAVTGEGLHPYFGFLHAVKNRHPALASDLMEEWRAVLIIYDITDNKRRTKMVKCLERYGVRVQKSAFEAFLTTRKYDELVARTTRLIDPHTDSLRIYLLANHTSVRSWGVGDRHVEDVIIF